MADHFYVAFPDDDEGTLTLRLHGEARMSTLADVARVLSLADYIQSQTGLDIASNDSVMADVVESIMAAIYLDSGLDSAKAFLERHWPLNVNAVSRYRKSPKSAFRNGACNVVSGYKYRQISKNGPDHAKMTYEVKIKGYDAISATAGSRKSPNRPRQTLLKQLQKRTYDL